MDRYHLKDYFRFWTNDNYFHNGQQQQRISVCKCYASFNNYQHGCGCLNNRFEHLDAQRNGHITISNMSTSPVNHSQFLPEFLLGDDTQLSINNTEDGLTSRLGSPGNADSCYMSTSASAMHHVSPHSRLTPLRPDYNRGTTARLNGPPTASLFDEKSENTPPSSNITTPSSPTNQMETSPIADTTQDSDGYWIVVFGFPATHSSHILSIFSQVGNILEHSIPPSGNWMFIKYSSRIDVRKALTYDKRIVSGNVMIGVTERKNINQMRPLIVGTPNSSFNNVMMSPSSPKSPRIRHLAIRRDIQGAEPTSIPQKDDSIVSKAVDLIFGW